jgi:amino acid transporter
MFINLRGERDSGLAFVFPTYVFVTCLSGVIVVGLIKTVLHGGHPAPVAPIPKCAPAMTAVSLWLLVKAFSSGCTAMTGVEAVSNGVPVFREPNVKNARGTLTTIIASLTVMLAGIAYLCRVCGIAATPPDQPGYQSVLSQLTTAVSGRNIFYYVTMGAILGVLALSANTSFADFSRVCRSNRGERLSPVSVHDPRTTVGVFHRRLRPCIARRPDTLVFEGITNRLIPLFTRRT